MSHNVKGAADRDMNPEIFSIIHCRDMNPDLLKKTENEQ